MKLRFFIYLNDDELNKTPVTPVYKDDVSVDTELENNQKFYRDKFSGKISFIKKDFDFIMDQDFETQYVVLIEKSNDFGLTWEFEFKGKFFRTDCKINYDDKKIEMQLDPIDRYVDILAGLDKEFNLIELAPEIMPLYMQKRPLIQVYQLGEKIVSCFLSGASWEQDVNDVILDGNVMINTYKFSICSRIETMRIKIDGAPLDAAGLYTKKIPNDLPNYDPLFSTTGYRIDLTYNSTGNFTAFALTRISDSATVFFGTKSGPMSNLSFTINLNPIPGNGASGTCTLQFDREVLYARYLTDRTDINGLTTSPIPADDIVDNNRNYNYVIGYAIDVITISTRFSTEPTKWGRADDSTYFLPPYSLPQNDFFPVAQSRWIEISYWFSFSLFDEFLELDGRKQFLLRDSFPIHSAISVLLKQIAPNIIHEGTEEYSQFLYKDENQPLHFNRSFKLTVTQKTNILNSQYQNPAQKSTITLQDIFNMLKNCFRCFWYIDDENKLKIEHVEYFNNGGSYDVDPVISHDVTTSINIRNGKDWGFSTSEVSYDKVDMAERMQFKWMDDVTPKFEGEPIEILSKYVTLGKVDDINISKFTSDVDYMLLNPTEMNKDGFALLAYVRADAFKDPIYYGGRTLEATNGYSSQRYDIKDLFAGVDADIEITGNVLSGLGTTNLVFYNGSGAIINESYVFTPDPAFPNKFIITIPNGTASIGIRTPSGHVVCEFVNLNPVNAYEVPIIPSTTPFLNTIYLQNGVLSFALLQPNFYVYDMPAKRAKINNVETYVQVDKKKKQTLSFPINENVNEFGLIKTHIGNGQIDKISLNLHSQMTKTTLKYDTE